MWNNLKSYMTHPLARGLDMDDPETTVIRSEIIREKPFLKQLYQEWYQGIANSLPENLKGPVLELGSGGGFLEEYIPGLITSEILNISNVDVILDGRSLPIHNDSLRGIVMFDVFHHIPDAGMFLSEAARTIKPGGVLVMHEPWITKWSHLVYQYLHHEPVNTEIRNWDFPAGGPLSQANSALPWIVFCRDLIKFTNEHPQWEPVEIKSHTPFTYILSGGVSCKQFMPGSLFHFWRGVEKLFQPCMNSWAMFATIKIIKK